MDRSKLPNRREEFKAKRKREVDEVIGGRELVPWALEHPEEFKSSLTLQNALFGRHYWYGDESSMIKHITKRAATHTNFVTMVTAYPDEGSYLSNINIWKLAYCDSSIVKNAEDLASLYISRLRDEELQPPEERARELIRNEAEKTARRNAKWMIPEIEKLGLWLTSDVTAHTRAEKEPLLAIWQRVSPPPPRWIQAIVDNGQPWGLVFYRSAETEQTQYGGANWPQTWKEVQHDIRIPYPDDRRPFMLNSIHQGGSMYKLDDLSTETWPQDEGKLSLEDDEAILEHFREYRQTIKSPNILRNTCIIIDKEEMDKNLDEWTVTFPTYWAYDPDWQMPTKSDTTSEEEAEQLRLGYRGRLRVPYLSMDAWFYAARWEGASLYKMWLKAQEDPDHLWYGATKYMEQWDHEPFV